MKKIILVCALMATFISCKNEKTEDTPVVQAEEIAVNYQSFGDAITDKDVLEKDAIIEKYNSLKPGDTIAVKFSTQVKEVCQKKGCWMKVDMGKEEAMVRFKDYAFFMPKDISGKSIIAEGKAYAE